MVIEMERQNLLLITSNFPYGKKGDNSFLVHEIESLSQTFERMDILSTSDEDEITHILPNNVFAHRKRINKLEFRALINTVLSIFTPKTIKEYVFARKNFKASFKEIITGIAKYYYAYFNLKKEIMKLTTTNTIVYSYWLSSRSFAVARLKKKGLLKNKTISRCHGFDCYAENGHLPFRREIISNTDEIYFISEHGRNYFKKKYIPLCPPPCAKLQIARLGLSYEGVYTESDSTDMLRLVSCSNIVEVKRLDRIIDALSSIKCNVNWTHIGSGKAEYELKIKNYAQEKLLNKPNIEFHFTGFLPVKDIRSKYLNGDFDLFINTSQSEGIPVSIMEAYSCSLPAIGLNIGGVSEIIPNDSNFLLDENVSPEQIGEAIERYAISDSAYRKDRKQDVLKIYNTKYCKDNALEFSKAISQQSVCIVTASVDQFKYANLDITMNYENVVFIPLYRPLSHFYQKAMRRIWYWLNLPRKSIWYSPRLKNSVAYHDSIVVFDSFLGTEIFPYLAKRTNADLHCWFWNIVGNRASEITIIKKYAKVWSFDKDDCAKYTLEYNHQFYGEVEQLPMLPTKPYVTFVGRNKNRYIELLSLADYLESHSISYEFYIFDNKLTSDRKNIKIIKKFMPYEDVLSIISKSTCLVDFVQSGQTGLTLRTLESIFNGRQVITNNAAIKEEDFNKENIYIIERGYRGLAEFILRGPVIKEQNTNSYSFTNWIDRFRRQK